MSHSVFLTNQILKSIIPFLHKDWNVSDSNEPLIRFEQITALASSVWESIDADYLVRFPNLKVICHLGIGTDNIDLNYLKKHNIVLLAQPNAGVHDTAEMAFTLMLSLARKIMANDQYIRSNQWAAHKPRSLGNHLLGKQIGLIGLGQIGSMIARFASAFEMNIAYCARNELNNSYTYYKDVNSLALASDFLIVCCSGGVQTQHLVNESVLRDLGTNGYLINVARGSVVDEQALIYALTHGVIAGAGLDVFANEPNVPESLVSLKNVILSPHMGSSTEENLNLMFQLQAEQLNDFLYHFSQ